MGRTFRSLLIVMLALGLLAPGVSVTAAEPLTLDLAALNPNGVTTRPGGRDVTYDTIVILNRIPRFHYSVDFAIEDVGIDALTLDGFDRGAAPEGVLPPPGQLPPPSPCLALIDKLIDELDAAETEKEVSEIGAAARAGAGANCKDEVWEEFKGLTQKSQEQKISVKSFQTLTVIISRPGVKFTVTFPGTARGEWRTSYGFFFVPDRDDRYFVKEESGKFKIRKDAGREEFDFVPTVVFTFFPRGASQQAGIGGWTAGLGYDLEKPFVFSGYSWAYNENVIFTGGIAFHPQSRLRGKYDVDEEVSAELEPEQLVEDTYGPNVYLGVSFRFNENIHARRAKLLEDRAKSDEAVAAEREKARAAEEEAKLRKAACLAQADADEAAAKAECKGDAVCIAKVEKETAAKKAKCAVTGLDRAKAEKEAREKQAAVEKAEARTACEKRVEAENTAALRECTKKLETCKKSAANATAVKACEEAGKDCRADADVQMTKGKEECLKR